MAVHVIYFCDSMCIHCYFDTHRQKDMIQMMGLRKFFCSNKIVLIVIPNCQSIKEDVMMGV